MGFRSGIEEVYVCIYAVKIFIAGGKSAKCRTEREVACKWLHSRGRPYSLMDGGWMDWCGWEDSDRWGLRDWIGDWQSGRPGRDGWELGSQILPLQLVLSCGWLGWLGWSVRGRHVLQTADCSTPACPCVRPTAGMTAAPP